MRQPSPRRLVGRLQFWLERQLLRGTSYQLLAVAALIGVISFVGGALVLPVQGGHLGESIWWAFLRLSDPGYLGDDAGVWRRIVSTVLTVAGYVVFLGALVAIMTQSLNSRMRRLESGLTPVATRNHIVVLGWTSRTIPVVRELLLSEGRVRRFLARRRTGRLRLVLLCADVTPRHAQALRDEPAIGNRARDIWLRTGTPLAVDDLERADCANAAAVIVPGGAPGSTLTGDMAVAKALLSLASMPRAPGMALPYVVAELQDQANLAVLRSAYPGPLEAVAGNSLIGRILAQSLRYPALSRVYAELLSHGVGCGVYLRQVPETAGLTLDEAAPRFDRAVLCGAVRWEGAGFVPHLNPAPDFRLSADDQLVFVTPGYGDARPRTAAAAPAPGSGMGQEPAVQGAAAVPAAQPRRHMLVLGWSSKVIGLLNELPSYRDEHFQVTVVSIVNAEDRARVTDAGPPANVAVQHVQADYAHEPTLRSLEPWTYDNVLLASSERLTSGEEADTRTLMGNLLLDAMLDARERDGARLPQVLLELQDPHNEPLIRGRRAEVLVSPQILAHVVAQAALRRELRAVYDALFAAGGTDLALLPAQRYAAAGRAWRYEELAIRVRRSGDTLLGWLLDGGHLRLDPPRSEPVRFGPNDRLVVLTSA